MASYDLSRHMLRACRALAKLIALNTIPDWIWKSETAFDGGEWSGPALAKVQEQLNDKATTTVAMQFGYMPSQLSKAFTYYTNEEVYMWMESKPSLGCYR